LINNGTVAASTAAGHKYGAEAGQATALLGGSVRNVAVVYIDVRGVGRRALLKSSAKGFVKARLKNGEVVRLQGDEHADGTVAVGEVEREDGEVVVGMSEVGKSSSVQVGQGKEGLIKRA
jgi:spartin